MQIHTYRVRSLAEALQVVRAELGPEAALLHTRYVGSPLWRWLGGRTIEVTASPDANVPSRLPSIEQGAGQGAEGGRSAQHAPAPESFALLARSA